uniref:Uncharacterized protein n=1 Tax=Sphaerodactylus townsendi TaxID=933632 RepID=A0ACB8FZB0_9SAUR
MSFRGPIAWEAFREEASQFQLRAGRKPEPASTPSRKQLDESSSARAAWWKIREIEETLKWEVDQKEREVQALKAAAGPVHSRQRQPQRAGRHTVCFAGYQRQSWRWLEAINH